MAEADSVLLEIEELNARVTRLWVELTTALSRREELVRGLMSRAGARTSSTRVFVPAGGSQKDALAMTQIDRVQALVERMRQIGGAFTLRDIGRTAPIPGRTRSRYVAEAVRMGLMRRVDRYRYAVVEKTAPGK